ncbi:glycohydrolase toxin TNT-related protein [Mycolicibacterium pallens]|uniref:Glycohydrolase toxin TNT-related protein n=1 Tax=Mycolicibacterium pallens TaxID=370524 RepID=A0ABX8VKP0_9MYCO|nr:TNT domain-containing protein [Mycolicibacterium pallens]QYL18356.1 glycohydrolase toxin TNT-related protein [Mycolicibacterium pallens]
MDPTALDGAGSALVDVGKDIGWTMSTLEGALSGCGSMCGNDPVGAAMGQKYDSTAAAVLQAIAAARNGLVNLGDGVRVSAHNYSMADAQSDVSGRTQPLPVPPASGKITASTPPSSVGAGDAAPAGFGWVAKYIGMIWPNGDSAQLRAAAAAWTAAGTQLLVTETSAAGPLGIVGAQQIPEAEAIGKAFTESINGAVQIMNQSTTIAAQLNAYAAKIDAVHAAIIDLLSRICDPMTGFKEVWDVLTGEDEDEIKKIADDIKTVIDNFKSETSALASEMTVAMSAAENIASSMTKYADKEWNQFLHGTEVGRLIDRDLRLTKGFFGQAENLVKDNWKYGPLRAMTQPDRWFNDWKETVTGMAPLVGLGGDGAPGVGESWKDAGKGFVHSDLWSKDPAEGLGANLFDALTFLVPGGGLGAAGKVTHGAADAAEAAAKAAPHVADAAPQVARDVAKGAEAAVPPPVRPPEVPAGGAPRPLPDAAPKPATPEAVPPKPTPSAPAEPRSAPVEGHGAGGPTERAPAGAAPEHAGSGRAEVPKVPGEPRPSVVDVPATAAERQALANQLAEAPASAPSAGSGGAGSALPSAPSAGALGSGSGHAADVMSSAAGGAGDRVPAAVGAHGAEAAADGAGHGPHPGSGDGGGGSHGGSGDHGGGGRPDDINPDPRGNSSDGPDPQHHHGDTPTASGPSHDPVHSYPEEKGDGWERVDDKPNDKPTYGEPLDEHWSSDHYPHPDEIDPEVRSLITDHDAPYGRDARGVPMSKEDYEARYNEIGPEGREFQNYPPNDGAVPHSKVVYDSIDAYIRDYGREVDRIGLESGKYLAVMRDGIAESFESRGLPISTLLDPYFSYSLTGRMPEGWHIEVSEVAPAFGREGGSLQVRIFDQANVEVRVERLKRMGVIR